MTPFPGGPCCWGWNEFLEAEPHHHLCDCPAPNRQRTSGKMMTEWFTQSVKGKAESRETPSCHSYSASASTLHWKRFNGGCVRGNDFSRIWMTCVWCHSRTGHGTHTMWRSKSCGHTLRSASMQARPTCGTGRVACRRGAMSCSGERCCTIRQHRSGGGLLSPRGSRGLKCWGCPLSHADFVTAQLETIARKHQVLLQAIPNVRDVQSAWLLLLHCAVVRANFYLRVVRPDLVVQFARTHDASLWQCMCRILGIPATFCDEMAKATATLPLALGGLGLRSAERSRVAAHWASWADTLPMIQERHPVVAVIVGSLAGAPESPRLGAVHAAAQELDGVGFVVPEWTALAGGLRPEPREPEHHELGARRMATRGCQLRGTPLSRNVHLASPQPNATGHVEIAERSSCRYSILDDPFILFDTVGTCSLPLPSPTSPFPSFARNQAHLPVWPSSRRLWPPPCSLLTVRSAGEKRLLVGKRSC